MKKVWICLAGLLIMASVEGAWAQDKTAQQDQQFLQKSKMGGNADIELGKLAIMKASTEDIKNVARRIVQDHMTMEANMAPLAQRLGASEPPQAISSRDQAEFQKLNGMAGAGFDQEYITYMIVSHRQDIKDFSKEESSTSDKQLKGAVANGLRTIRGHLLMLENTAKADGMVFPRA